MVRDPEPRFESAGKYRKYFHIHIHVHINLKQELKTVKVNSENHTQVYGMYRAV